MSPAEKYSICYHQGRRQHLSQHFNFNFCISISTGGGQKSRWAGVGAVIIRACAVTPTGETAMTITRVCSQFAFAVAYIDRLASSQKLIDLLKLNTTLFLIIFSSN